MGATGVIEYRTQQLATVNLTNGLINPVKLPSQYFWTALQISIDATSANGPPASVLLDGELNLVTEMQLKVNGTPLITLPLADQYFRFGYTNKTQGSRVAPTTTIGTIHAEMEIPLSLPWPLTTFARHATGLPAALINSIEMRISVASDMIAAVFGTPGTTSYSSGPVMRIQAICIDMPPAEMIQVVRDFGHGYVQTVYTQPVSQAGDLDLELTSGGGVLKDLYFDARKNSLHDDSFVTNQKLLLGASTYPLDSTYLQLRGRAKNTYDQEPGTSGAIGTSAGQTTGQMNGTWMNAFDTEGSLLAGVDLRGWSSVKLRSTYGSTTGTCSGTAIMGVLVPQFYHNIGINLG